MEVTIAASSDSVIAGDASTTHSNRSSTPLAPLCTAINKPHFKPDLSPLPQTAASADSVEKVGHGFRS